MPWKNKHLKLIGFEKISVSRNDILQNAGNDVVGNPTYKVKAFLGPRQPPDAGELPYKPPLDWPPKGYCLRAPQVVWLFIGFRYQFPTQYRTDINFTYDVRDFNISEYENGFITSGSDGWSCAGFFTMGGQIINLAIGSTGEVTNAPPSNSFGPWIFNPAASTPSGKQWYQTNSPSGMFQPGDPGGLAGIGSGIIQEMTRSNNYPDIYNSIKSAYQTVKTKIEKIRPNRTWVEIIDPWIYDSTTDKHDKTGLHTLDPLLSGYPYYGIKDRYFLNQQPAYNGQIQIVDQASPYWMAIYPNKLTNFLGSNFLHIHCGDGTITQFGNGLLANDPGPGLAILNNIKDKFYNYKVRAFWINGTVGSYASYSGSPPTPPTFTLGNNGSHPVIVSTTFNEFGRVWSPVTSDFINSQILTINQEINTQNTVFGQDSINSQMRQPLFGMETNLNSIGIDCKVLGNHSLLTEDYITTLIAKEYGFDKDTGKDLTQ
jgi:hypothetical protein